LTEALAARHVRFGYSTRPLLEDFSLEILEGEFAGLLGPNGAGKTTLLRLLSGSLSPQSGTVLLFGENLRTLPPRRRARELAVVPQESRILFPFTALEIVLMGRFPHLGILGMESKSETERGLSCLEEVGMLSCSDSPIQSLSSGERQRVLIARALAQEPRVLLLDEPTAFLDLKHRLRIYEILSRLNRERRLTILTISHDLNLAARHCRRLWLLKEGKSLAAGSPEEVLTPGLIEAAYETEVVVGRDPRSHSPWIIPYSSRDSGGAS
jgi:iron complex transport system ATP-binding protein